MSTTKGFRSVAIFCIVTFVGGCSSPGALFDRSGYTISELGSTPDQLLETAKSTAIEYRNRADSLENSNWFADIPLYAGAVALASAIYYGAPLDVIAGITIGAGSIAAGRTVLKPTSRAAGYYEGGKAMRCIFQKGQPYKSAPSEITVSALNGGNLPYLINNLSGAVRPVRDPYKVDDQQNTKTYELARQAYESALSAGETALVSARKQLEAAKSASADLSGSILAAEEKVKRLVRLEPIDFSTVVSAINASLSNAATQRAEIIKLKKDLAGVKPASAIGDVAAQNTDDESEVEALKRQTAVITQYSNAITNYPVDYVQAKADVETCAALGGQN